MLTYNYIIWLRIYNRENLLIIEFVEKNINCTRAKLCSPSTYLMIIIKIAPNINYKQTLVRIKYIDLLSCDRVKTFEYDYLF